MEKMQVYDEQGNSRMVFPRDEFMQACADYLHEKRFKMFLDKQRWSGLGPDEAIAKLRAEMGATTLTERRQAWADKQERWRAARELKAANKRPVGRPAKLGAVAKDRGKGISLAQCKTRIAAAILNEIVAIEKRHTVDQEIAQLFAGMRQQLGAW